MDSVTPTPTDKAREELARKIAEQVDVICYYFNRMLLERRILPLLREYDEGRDREWWKIVTCPLPDHVMPLDPQAVTRDYIAGLRKRAEQAEAALKAAEQEIEGLKAQIELSGSRVIRERDQLRADLAAAREPRGKCDENCTGCPSCWPLPTPEPGRHAFVGCDKPCCKGDDRCQRLACLKPAAAPPMQSERPVPGPNHKDGCDGQSWRYSGSGYNRVKLCACGAEDHAPQPGVFGAQFLRGAGEGSKDRHD